MSNAVSRFIDAMRFGSESLALSASASLEGALIERDATGKLTIVAVALAAWRQQRRNAQMAQEAQQQRLGAHRTRDLELALQFPAARGVDRILDMVGGAASRVHGSSERRSISVCSTQSLTCQPSRPASLDSAPVGPRQSALPT